MIGTTYPVGKLAEAVDGRAEGYEKFPPPVDRVIIDSRGAEMTPGTLFIALKGPRHDGHEHIPELQQRGIGHFMVDEAYAEQFPGAQLIVVRDTLEALQRFAAHHRAQFNIPVIGITGSNGKTVVKEWLWQMLHTSERIVRSPGSWNSQVGVPMSVLRMGSEHTLAIFEAGISKPGEMDKLEEIIRPTIGVFTHVGDAHDEGFRDVPRPGKFLEKLRLFTHADTLVCPNILSIFPGMLESLPGTRMKRWGLLGLGARDFVVATENRIMGDGTQLRLRSEGEEADYWVPFTDEASVENAMSCVTVCLHLGRSPAWINERLAHLTPVDMRMRTVQGTHGTTLIDDSYSLDQSSLTTALSHLRHVAHGRPMVAVLSDLAESGEEPQRLYGEVAKSLAQCGVQQLIGIGQELYAQRAQFDANARFHPDVDALLKAEDTQAFAGAAVLIKGARRFGFERIVERWQQQVHGTELEIDLGAVRHNLNHYRAQLAPGVRTMAMVKAFGYGSGALELARLFEHERVHYLGVAYADEGIELRSNGITLPIMVMNPEPVAMETLHRFRLEAEVYDMRSLREALTSAQRMPDAPPAHIKLDTGMHRLGFVESELPQLLDALRGQQALKVASILSHLVASEDPAHDAFTRAQITTFTRMAQAISEVLGYRPLWHMANSAGIARWPEAHFDMVRLGIGLHGIGVDEAETSRLLPTVTLRTVIAQLKTIPAGDSVSYGRRFIAERETRIATLPIGYADGLSRRLGNGVGKAWINGQPAPFVGSICMDMCMVDVTGLACALDDEVILFGPGHPVQEYAKDLGTIPYEALTSISQRVRRVYVHG